MGPFHIFVSVANLIVLVAFVIGIAVPWPDMLAFGVIGGYFANLLALVTAAVLLMIVLIRVPVGTARGTFKRQWLGFANAAVVIAAWSIYFAVGKLPTN